MMQGSGMWSTTESHFVMYFAIEYKLFVKIKYVLSILLSDLYISEVLRLLTYENEEIR
jgi:hypothetical protein